MDVYRQAAHIVEKVHQGTGTAKALCLQKQTQKKRQTFAVVCETVRHLERIQRLLDDTHFFRQFPELGKTSHEKYIVYSMCYDAVYGRGVNTRQHPAAISLMQTLAALRAADARLPKLEKRSFAERETLDSGDEADAAEGDASDRKPATTATALDFPRYARINTLMLEPGADINAVLAKLQAQTFRRSGVASRRERGGDDTSFNNDNGGFGGDTDMPDKFVVPSGFGDEKPKWDAHIPGLVLFPSGTDLHAHPMVRRGSLVLQDKASCIPAAVLCDRVDVLLAATGKASQLPPNLFELFVDGCAAPGNKTSQVAEYVAQVNAESEKQKRLMARPSTMTDPPPAKAITIVATERDPKRFKLLTDRMAALGATAVVKCVNAAFEEALSEADMYRVNAILLDPSCSSSGVVSRVDVDKKRGGANADSAAAKDKVAALAAEQYSLLVHALTAFPNATRVVYSTCSVHQQENEAVVLRALRAATDALVSGVGASGKGVAATAAAKAGAAAVAKGAAAPAVTAEGAPSAAAQATMSKAAKKKMLRKLRLSEPLHLSPWTLSNIMPGAWRTRGRVVEPIEGAPDVSAAELQRMAAYTVRCDPDVDRTSGFYIARFDRVVVPRTGAGAGGRRDDGSGSDCSGDDEEAAAPSVGNNSRPVGADAASTQAAAAPKAPATTKPAVADVTGFASIAAAKDAAVARMKALRPAAPVESDSD